MSVFAKIWPLTWPTRWNVDLGLKTICAIARSYRDASTGFLREALRPSGADRHGGSYQPPPPPLAKVVKYRKRARVNPRRHGGWCNPPITRGGTFYKMLGLYLRFHARFIHATFIGVMLNFWKVGVAPTTPLYTKTPPLPITRAFTGRMNIPSTGRRMGKLGQAQAWRNEFRGGGTRPSGPLRKRDPSAKGPTKCIQK